MKGSIPQNPFLSDSRLSKILGGLISLIGAENSHNAENCTAVSSSRQESEMRGEAVPGFLSVSWLLYFGWIKEGRDGIKRERDFGWFSFHSHNRALHCQAHSSLAHSTKLSEWLCRQPSVTYRPLARWLPSVIASRALATVNEGQQQKSPFCCGKISAHRLSAKVADE